MTKTQIKDLLLTELSKVAKELKISREVVLIEPKDHGDLTTNMAMGNKGIKPLDLAQKIVEKINDHKNELGISNIEIAGPGFINFFIKKSSFVDGVNQILELGQDYGRGNRDGNINIEWVSANPTGFMHVGHARNAAIGSTIANICEFSGLNVTREYYINDAGNQINLLAQSVFARYQQIFNPDFQMPEDAYFGEDIIWAANEFKNQFGNKYKNTKLENEVLDIFKQESVTLFLSQIRHDLARFNVYFDKYFSEKSLYTNNSQLIKHTLNKLKNTYTKDGALWLKTTLDGDDKDRVLIKSDGSYTYFLPDIAYHNIKFNSNGKDPVILNVWGADHSGYVKRMESAMKNLGHDSDKLIVLCMQLVRLIKNGEEFKMSKRKGTSFWLREFIDLVGSDSARFILLDRTTNTKLDFDIDLATTKTNDNPSFLVQYSNARAFALLEKANASELNLVAQGYDEEADIKLISTLLEFPEIIEKSADKLVTNLLTQYAIKLAKEFNSWYSNTEKIIDKKDQTSALALVKSVNIVLENSMKLLGISIPHKI
ncbi:arginine--tRNA ligase [Mycoplasma zalophidermidis]|uniref:Arginine--tRNA ligase n=1 Tax=Mycoplasma zalophidermidis TaxID=398174 RepID=A0ABS6DRM8_9MOLU|nr:arginine--tRNA ligase [Mycoplasma zalophidermidis]MBU4693660.1 arginine--tRNA ligase [Mycoplasma zalophidermidis]MCR8966744.1 arginine--tRNA ligase [Mycoplasma zalophidermidis]